MRIIVLIICSASSRDSIAEAALDSLSTLALMYPAIDALHLVSKSRERDRERGKKQILTLNSFVMFVFFFR